MATRNTAQNAPDMLAWGLRLLLACAIGVVHLGAQSQMQSGRKDPDPFRTALEPFWRAKVIRETVLFTRHPGGTPEARLLFRPRRILRVTSVSHDFDYMASRDYRVDAGSGRLYLTRGSRIPFKPTDDMYPLLTSLEPTIRSKADDPNRGVLWAEGTLYRALQTEVTYENAPGEWRGYIPRFAGESLPRTLAKLRGMVKLTIFLLGDSIAQGASSSKSIMAPPFVPSFGELVAGGLQRVYPASQTANLFRNYAVGGWGVGQGVKQSVDLKLGAERPDLVIVAFGMNDVGHRDPDGFGKSTKHLMDAIRKDSPETEFLLIAPMLGNPEWRATPSDQFPLYRDALQALTGPGVALADITAIWEEMLKRKSFFDVTGNGVNHPNDFGHMVYAQTILALLVPGPVAWVKEPDQTTSQKEYVLAAGDSLPGPNGPVTYEWKLAKRSKAAVISRSGTAAATARFMAGPGTYSFEVTVTDTRGETSTAPLRVTYFAE